MGKDRSDRDQDLLLALPEDLDAVDDDRLTDVYLETPLGPDANQKRLLRLFGAARTAEEEQGVNILYLALGFLRWKESKDSEIVREAPLVLLPVELVRNQRTSGFDVRARDEELATNLPLKERLHQDFGLILPELEETEGWRPSTYFAATRDAVESQPGWSIDDDGLQLGFFSFAKLLMHRDLDPANWPDGTLADNELIGGLLQDGFEPDEPIFGPDDKLDKLLDPAEIIQVIEADASQTKVIEEVRRGSNLVVQGPPGTGKSQTITNIIAAAAHDGKSVLFVAEKMAALSVVHDRLVRSGLRDICLELHSRTANKKDFAQELGRTLIASQGALPAIDGTDRLRSARDELNDIAALLHEPMESGDSPFGALSELSGLIGRGCPPPSITLDGLDRLGPEMRAEGRRSVEAFRDALAATGAPDSHPFAGVGALDLQPMDLARLGTDLRDALQTLRSGQAMAASLSEAVKQARPESLAGMRALADTVALLSEAPTGAMNHAEALYASAGEARLIEALSAGRDWAAAKSAEEATFADAAWAANLAQIRAGLVRGQSSFLSRLFGPYRRASREFSTLLSVSMPKAPADRLALVDRLAAVQAKRKSLADDETWLQSVMGPNWRGERTDFAGAVAAAEWFGRLRWTGSLQTATDLQTALHGVSAASGSAVELRQAGEEASKRVASVLARLEYDLAEVDLGQSLDEVALDELAGRLAAMQASTDRYAEWSQLGRCISALKELGAGAIVDAVLAGRLAADAAVDEFLYACAEARWLAARTERPRLNDLAGTDRHAIVDLFQRLEAARIDETRDVVLSRHYQQVPRGSAGEMSVIRGEIARKRGHKPIRWVMKHAGGMVQRIKPVMLMSPISVAQYLPPGILGFDLLVIDEASQVRPEDSLGVVARAKQIVVVGDQKQLPPTSFFDRMVSADEGEEDDDSAPVGAGAAEMESILSLCDARGVRQRVLEWHYRSRDPSLIRVSNAEFYENRLVLPPSPLEHDDNYGMKFHRVPGVYSSASRGGGRATTNKIEAQAVVAAVARHAREWPELSLGIVAFSKAQADMLTEVLEHERRLDPVLDTFLREGQNEYVFVKNIENVQGDERDVIMISVGYGPHEPNGRLSSMSFGPVNGEGGERRLNVLFSRARVRCDVFASFDPLDVDPSRSSREGPKILKRYLEFARSGLLDDKLPTGLGTESPLEEDVASVIRGLGYDVDAQVGSAGFRVDLAVRNPDRPGQYLVAVECDGSTYHSALWARERDRLRQQVLEGLGWNFHRIWSTDWFHRRTQEIARMTQALATARAEAGDGIAVRGANAGYAAERAEMVDEGVEIALDEISIKVPTYVRAEIVVRSSVEPHEAPLNQLADLTARIVEIEGPIHTEEVARRVTTAFGKSRTGRRILTATLAALNAARRRQDSDLVVMGDFWMTRHQAEEPPVRDRSAESGPLLKGTYLPPVEITAAAKLLQSESGEMAPEELVRAISRVFGFQRVGSELNTTILAALAS